MDEGVFDAIASDNLDSIISGLSYISDLIHDDLFDLSSKECDKLFQLLIPLLNHNHYKLRSIACSLTEYLFLTHFDAIYDPTLAIPLFCFSLSSINKNIVRSSIFCLRVIFENLDSSIWWNEIEHCLLNSRSQNVRFHLLTLLSKVPNKIPLHSIAILLDDPNIKIRNLAETIFFNADEEIVKNALSGTKLSLSAYQKLSKVHPTIKETTSNSTNFIEKKPKTKQNIKPKINCNTQINTSTHSYFQQHIKSKQLTQQNESTNNNKTTTEISISFTQNQSAEIPSNSYYKMRTRKQKTEQIKTNTTRRIPNETKLKQNNINKSSSNNTKQIPKSKITQPRKQSIKFLLHDFTHETWLEKSTFLEILLNTIESNQPLLESGMVITESVLTTAFPIHKKTAPLLAKVLSYLILLYPEILGKYLNDIISFVLHAVRNPPALTKDNELLHLVQSLIQETSFQSLADNIINVVTKTQRPLMYEQLFLFMYENKPNEKLWKSTLHNLLCLILYSKKICGDSPKEKLLFLLCEKEPDECINYYFHQPKEIQDVLIKYIPREIRKKYQNNSVN